MLQSVFGFTLEENGFELLLLLLFFQCYVWFFWGGFVLDLFQCFGLEVLQSVFGFTLGIGVCVQIRF